MSSERIDLSPLGHAIAAVAIQVFFGVIFGHWWMGGAVGSAWFIAREQTQAEYRWIANFGDGKRANMPWYGGFEIKAWDWCSVLDFLVPVTFCIFVAIIMS